MVKGVAVKFQSYEETIPKLLKVLKFDEELKKHDKIILKPNLVSGKISESTPVAFVEQVVRYVMANKNPGTEIFIAEGCDGFATMDVFEELGYNTLAEKYDIGLIDLNNAETGEINDPDFVHFESVHYPQILLKGFVVSMPKLVQREDSISGASDNMIGAFPAKHYRSFFSKKKNKLRNVPFEHQVYDILQCKYPNFSLIDASEKGYIFAGQALEMDKQAAKLLGLDWGNIEHLKILENPPKKEEIEVES